MTTTRIEDLIREEIKKALTRYTGITSDTLAGLGRDLDTLRKTIKGFDTLVDNSLEREHGRDKAVAHLHCRLDALENRLASEAASRRPPANPPSTGHYESKLEAARLGNAQAVALRDVIQENVALRKALTDYQNQENEAASPDTWARWPLGGDHVQIDGRRYYVEHAASGSGHHYKATLIFAAERRESLDRRAKTITDRRTPGSARPHPQRRMGPYNRRELRTRRRTP